mmetsp:Transcript_14484/g.33446  ORF Transcript_14484/g.33446 Transcript_14484/m.33446 type:complete len:295 (+) Transcript_14484:19-903(+)
MGSCLHKGLILLEWSGCRAFHVCRTVRRITEMEIFGMNVHPIGGLQEFLLQIFGGPVGIWCQFFEFFVGKSTIRSRITSNSIGRITHNGMTKRGKVTIQLMVPSGYACQGDSGYGQSVQFLSGNHLVLCEALFLTLKQGLLSDMFWREIDEGPLVFEGRHAHKGGEFVVLHEGQIDDSLVLLHVSAHEGLVLSLDPSCPETLTHHGHPLPGLDHDHETGRVHAKPMHHHFVPAVEIRTKLLEDCLGQVWELAHWSWTTQCALRFVEHNDVLVLVDDPTFEFLRKKTKQSNQLYK